MKRTKWVLAVTLAGVLAAAGAALASSRQPGGGAIRVWSPQSSNLRGTIVVTGAIADRGTTLTINQKGKPDPSGDYVTVKLRHGSFEINATALNDKLNHQQPTIEKATCSLYLSGTGPVRVMNGAGAYKGIGGTLTITGMHGEVARQLPGGRCDDAPNAAPEASYTALFGGGKVNFG